MKYGIEGIEKSKTIKSTQVLNVKDSGKAIIVNYLDGTQDVFELNDDNLKKIVDIAETQGKKFTLKPSKRLISMNAIRSISIGLFTTSIFANIFLAITGSISSASAIISVIFAMSTLVSTIDVSKSRNYEKKYKLYYETVKTKLEEYKEILEKEKQLTKAKTVDSIQLDNVLDLDNVSLKQVQSIAEKVERYQSVEKTKVKIKEKNNSIDVRL